MIAIRPLNNGLNIHVIAAFFDFIHSVNSRDNNRFVTMPCKIPARIANIIFDK